MPATEPARPGTRDEWLAEVRRRGEQLRRRRRIAVGTVVAVVLVVPALAYVVRSGPGSRPISVTAAGPTGATTPAAEPPVPAPPTTGTTDPVATPTTEEIHRRIEAINGSPVQPSPGAPAGDDPVVHAPTTMASGGAGSGVASSPPVVSPPSTVPAVPNGELVVMPPCPAADVVVTVAVDQPAYKPGQTVKGTTTIKNLGPMTCLLAPRENVTIDDAYGREVSNFAVTQEYREPVQAAPGRTLTATFTWDERDCSASPCVPAPPGTYTVVARWTMPAATYGPATATFTVG